MSKNAKTAKGRKSTGSLNSGIRNDYVLLLMNATTELLSPLLSVASAKLQEKTRRVVTAIDAHELKTIIMSEKENIEILAAKELLQSGMDAPAEVLVFLIRQRIAEILVENERILSIQQINNNFDFLEHWTLNDDPKIALVAPSAKVGKGKDAKPAKGVAKVTKNGKKTESSPPKLVTLEPPLYATKNWSPLAKRGQSSNKQEFVEDGPVVGPSLYIVLIGLYSYDVLKRLVNCDIPVISVHKLLPSFNSTTVMLPNSEPKITTFWHELELAKNDAIYKKTAFVELQLPVLNDNDLKTNSTEIAAEFCALVYDTQDIQRQHQNYLKHFHNYRVTEHQNFQLAHSYQIYHEYFQDMPNEHIEVEHVLHAIIHQVEALCNVPATVKRQTRQTHTTPSSSMENLVHTITALQCSVGDKIVVEAQDILMQNIFNGHEADIKTTIHYNDHMQVLTTGLKDLQFIWQNISSNENKLKTAVQAHDKDNIAFESALNYLFLRTSDLFESSNKCDKSQWDGISKLSLNSICDRIKGIIRNLKEFDRKKKIYYDMLTNSAVQQQLSLCYQDYDQVEYRHCPLTDTLIVKFQNNGSPFQTTHGTAVLPTSLCFRDYVAYVMPEQLKWIEKEEKRYDSRRKSIAELKQSLESSCTASVADFHQTEFYRNKSLKQQLIDEAVRARASKDGPDDPVIAAVPKPKKKRRSSTMISAPSKTTDNTSIQSKESFIMSFAGYDLDDRRFQLNTKTSIYRSTITEIRYERQDWLYRNRFLNIKIQTLGTFMCFGQIFNGHGNAESNIHTVHLKCKNNTSIEMITVDNADTLSPILSSHSDSSTPHSNCPVQQKKLSLNISWPNGLQIKTIAGSISDESVAIEQSWMVRRRCNEIKRIFYGNVGAVVIYYDDGTVKVLTSTGVIYETAKDYKASDEMMPTEPHQQQQQQHVYRDEIAGDNEKDLSDLKLPISQQQKHIDAIGFLTSLDASLSLVAMKMTTSNGCSYIIENGQIIKELSMLCIKEKCDYRCGEIFMRRKDGVKLLYGNEELQCLYADGSKITTAIYMQDIKEFLGSDSSQISINGSTNTLLVAASCMRTFKSQHPNYATVIFDERTGITLLSPGQTVLYSPSRIQVTLDGVSLCCDLDGLLIEATKCAKHSKPSRTYVNLIANEKNILESRDGVGNLFYVNAVGEEFFNANDLSLKFGESMRSEEAGDCESCTAQLDVGRTFVINRSLEGYELIEAEQVLRIIKESEKNILILNTNNENLITMSPFVDLDKKFQIPTENLEKFKNNRHDASFSPVLEFNVKLLSALPEVMLQRCFIAVDNEFQNLADIVTMVTKKPQKKTSTIARLSTKEQLCEIAHQTIEFHLHSEKRSFDERNTTKEKPSSNRFLEKITMRKCELERDHMYKQVLRTYWIPKYFDFHNCGGHVKHIDSEIFDDQVKQKES